MGIINRRYQHPVGQGFFHSGSVESSQLPALSYIYDCGSMPLYASAREREIIRYLKYVGKQKKLDILFISHVHADHINGLEQLLHKDRGLDVDTIILPNINVADRLIAFARTAETDYVSALNSFYRDFVIDPGEALSRFNPRQILFVEPGNRDDGAPAMDVRPPDAPDGPGVMGLRIDGDNPSWKLIGRGNIRTPFQSRHKDTDDVGPISQLIIQDTMALVKSTKQGDWLLAPYVDHTIVSQRNQFLRILAKKCKIAYSRIDDWLAVTENAQKLVTKSLDLLVAAYDEVGYDLNTTSLCLYSGPGLGLNRSLDRRHQCIFGKVQRNWLGTPGPIGWLGTGDAKLGQIKRIKALATHYGDLLKEVVTLTLPHHGSDHNFDLRLLKIVDPLICVAAADKYSSWKHPGSHTVQAVCSYPAVMHVVTSKKPSRGREVVLLG